MHDNQIIHTSATVLKIVFVITIENFVIGVVIIEEKVIKTTKKTNSELYIEHVLNKWNSPFKILPADQDEIRKYLEKLLISEDIFGEEEMDDTCLDF